jgi:hypothetical protein
VRVHRERFLHAKLYIVDNKAYAGSANMTCNALEGLGLVGGVVWRVRVLRGFADFGPC